MIRRERIVITEKVLSDLDRELTELENNIDGKHLENADNTDGNKEFVNTNEDNSIDRTEANSSPNSLKGTEVLIMKHDIQTKLKVIKNEEKTLNSLLATVTADNVRPRSFELSKKNESNSISQQVKKSNNGNNHSEENHNTNVIIEQDPNTAVQNNGSEQYCNANNDGSIIGIASVKQSISKNIDAASITVDNQSQEIKNSTFTEENPTNLTGTTLAVDSADQKAPHEGQTISVLEQLDPRHLRARIIFDDDDDDDEFYFCLGDNGSGDTSTNNVNDHTNIVDIPDAVSNSGEVRDVSNCNNPYIADPGFAVGNKSLSVDKQQQVAYVKELIKECNEEFVCNKNKLELEHNSNASEGCIDEAINDNQVHDVQKKISDINHDINQTIAIARLSDHDHTYTKRERVNASTKKKTRKIGKNEFIKPKTSINVDVAEKNQSKSDNINVNDTNYNCESNSDQSETNVTHKDQNTEIHEPNVANGSLKTGNVNRNEPNLSDEVEGVHMHTPKDSDELNSDLTNESSINAWLNSVDDWLPVQLKGPEKFGKLHFRFFYVLVQELH